MDERPPSRQPLPKDAERVFSGVLFDVYQWQQELYDGSKTTFEKLHRNDSAVVIPVLEDGMLLLAEDEQPGRLPVLTFPGGQGEEGEHPEELARRELLEETGYTAGELALWRAIQPSSKIDWAIYIYIARNCTKVTEPQLDPGERIILRPISLDELIDLAEDPAFQNKEIVLDLVKARYDREERAVLEKTLFG
ncbi:NUDIX hydrolase [Patescibacteria group bacterium]|nr:NUDIX hydrolase [Patescibacteria group bacterium]MBU1500882.1 NUDIX hydrolase [Patescibacteria group bacterium]MBU2080937.1 NUDIX hydrolase [Patescibacteria group bacterium]MBU2124042.1 NUDIX hydrolase [Patescibacteria group bacterium]MBU2194667.1 NUDIX hydrolase [Patescibacteria group bacterium]